MYNLVPNMIHIPRTGGTSIIRFVESYSNYDFNLDEPEHWKHHLSAEHRQYDPKNFTIVRNPYAKIISAYKWRKINLDLNTWIKNTLESFSLKEYRDKGSSISIPPKDQNILLPCYNFIYKDNGEKICDDRNILRTENLELDFRLYLEREHKDYLFPEFSLLTHENKVKKKLSFENLSNECIKLINEIYHLDFETFGYIKRDV